MKNRKSGSGNIGKKMRSLSEKPGKKVGGGKVRTLFSAPIAGSGGKVR